MRLHLLYMISYHIPIAKGLENVECVGKKPFVVISVEIKADS